MRPDERVFVYTVIDGERNYQDNLPCVLGKMQGDFLTLIRVYAAKADAAWVRNVGHAKALHEVRKIAAIVVACFERTVTREQIYGTVDDCIASSTVAPILKSSSGAEYSVGEFLTVMARSIDQLHFAYSIPGREKDCRTMLYVLLSQCVRCMELHGALSR